MKPEPRADTDTEPLDFARRFLQLHGAAVEKNDAAIEALIPENLQALLDAPEHIRLSEDTEQTESGGESYTVTYGAPVLERMIGKAFETIPLTGCRLEFDYVKSGGFSRLLEEQLTFYGAAAAIETVADVTEEYLLAACRYTAQSDEQKEGLLHLAFKTDTGALVPEMAAAFFSAGCRTVFFTPNTEAAQKMAALAGYVEQAAPRFLEDRLAPFRQSMNRRFQRDIENLEEYYRSLEQEMQKNLEKPGLSDAARKDRQAKIDAIPDELESKKQDLFKKYSIKVRLQPAALMQIRTPAKKIACRLSIGKQRRQFFLTYNPVTRNLDFPPCSRCHKPLSHIHFDSQLEPVCMACRQ